MTVVRMKVTGFYLVIGLGVGLLLQSMLIGWLAAADVSHVVPATEYQHRIKPGGMVSVEFSSNKSRECVTQTTRWLWRDTPAGRREIIELAYSAMAFGHDLEDRPRDYRFMFEVPSFIAPGQWNVRTLHADYCWPWSWVLGPRLRMSPPIGLDVVAAN